MFMRNNRSKNGAVQPEQTAAKQNSEQKAERRLSTQPDVAPGEDLRFTPSMSSCSAINDACYESGISGSKYTTSYEQHIPYIGKNGSAAVMGGGGGDRKLSNP